MVLFETVVGLFLRRNESMIIMKIKQNRYLGREPTWSVKLSRDCPLFVICLKCVALCSLFDMVYGICILEFC